MGTAIVPLPPAAFLQATGEGEAVLARLVACRLRRRRNRRRPVRRRRAVRAAARRTGARRRRRRRRGGDRRAQTRRRRLPPASSRSRPNGAICSAVRWCRTELNGFDAVVFDPPRQGARSAGARACRKPRPGHRRGVMQSRQRSRATAPSWSTAAIGSPRSRRSISSAIRRMSRSSRGWRNEITPPLSSATPCCRGRPRRRMARWGRRRSAC